MRNVLQAAILTGALVICGSVTAAETREHDAHVHGTANLDIALVGQALAIDLYSPAMNIVGFEHAPGNETQHGELAAALTALRDVGRVFGITDAAGCRNVHSEATRVGGHEHDGHDDGRGGSETDHAEIQARYRFVCRAPGELERIHVRLFELFPATEAIRVQMLTESTQRAMVLMPDNPDVPF